LYICWRISKRRSQIIKLVFTDEEMNKIFNTIGTTAIMVKNIVDRIEDKSEVGAFISNIVMESERELDNFEHQEIIQALKDSPDGVATRSLIGVYNNGVERSNPDNVGPAMKICRTIVYHPNTFRYELVSPAHKTALKTYTPRVAK
jgi:hypothetical protein